MRCNGHALVPLADQSEGGIASEVVEVAEDDEHRPLGELAKRVLAPDSRPWSVRRNGTSAVGVATATPCPGEARLDPSSRPPTPTNPTGDARSREANASPPASCTATSYLLRVIEEMVIDADVSTSR